MLLLCLLIICSAASTTGRKSNFISNINGTILNSAQLRAVRLYADERGPRAFCVRSPPGSGKTLTAAAMAAEVSAGFRSGEKINQHERLLELTETSNE